MGENLGECVITYYIIGGAAFDKNVRNYFGKGNVLTC
jgi:hypothetical protein